MGSSIQRADPLQRAVHLAKRRILVASQTGLWTRHPIRPELTEFGTAGHQGVDRRRRRHARPFGSGNNWHETCCYLRDAEGLSNLAQSTLNGYRIFHENPGVLRSFNSYAERGHSTYVCQLASSNGAHSYNLFWHIYGAC